jgi:hypothetical protein
MVNEVLRNFERMNIRNRDVRTDEAESQELKILLRAGGPNKQIHEGVRRNHLEIRPWLIEKAHVYISNSGGRSRIQNNQYDNGRLRIFQLKDELQFERSKVQHG